MVQRPQPRQSFSSMAAVNPLDWRGPRGLAAATITAAAVPFFSLDTLMSAGSARYRPGTEVAQG